MTDEDLDSAFWFSMMAGTALALVCVASSGLLAQAFDEPQLESVLRVLSVNWILGALSSVPQSVLQRQLRFRSLAIRRLLAVTVSGATGVALAVAGAGVWSLVVMAVTQSAIGVIVLWSVSSWRPRWRLSLERLREMRRFAASVVALDVLRFFGVRGESFFIAAVIGPVALGYYAVANRFLVLLNEMFTSTIGTVAFPVFSRLQNDSERRRRALFSVVRMCSLAAFPVFCGLIVLAPELIPTVVGPGWEQSVLPAQLLALHGLRYSITYFIANVVLSTGNAALELGMELIGLAVKVVALIDRGSLGNRGSRLGGRRDQLRHAPHGVVGALANHRNHRPRLPRPGCPSSRCGPRDDRIADRRAGSPRRIRRRNDAGSLRRDRWNHLPPDDGAGGTEAAA